MVRKAFGLVTIGGIVVAIACAGKTVPDGPITDGGLSSACPSQPPAASSACGSQGVECEYGNDPSIACETIARCDSTGWTVTPPSTQGCPTPPLGPTCPATFASVVEGASCSTPTSCGYPQGTCTCEVYCGPQYPLGHTCEAGTPTTWHCEGGGGQPGCPAARPRVGSACSTDKLSCSYGDCNSIDVVCQGGLWHTQHYGCPISSQHYKRGIHYLSDDERREIADQAMDTRLATYQYTIGDRDPRLGFIIEDQPESFAVAHGKDRVDLYGYTSMTIAALQVQQDEIRQLEREVKELREEVSHCKR